MNNVINVIHLTITKINISTEQKLFIRFVILFEVRSVLVPVKLTFICIAKRKIHCYKHPKRLYSSINHTTEYIQNDSVPNSRSAMPVSAVA